MENVVNVSVRVAGVEYGATVDGDRVSIARGGVGVGVGRWTGRQIEDCPAVLGDAVYEALDAAITEALGPAAAVTAELERLSAGGIEARAVGVLVELRDAYGSFVHALPGILAALRALPPGAGADAAWQAIHGARDAAGALQAWPTGWLDLPGGGSVRLEDGEPVRLSDDGRSEVEGEAARVVERAVALLGCALIVGEWSGAAGEHDATAEVRRAGGAS